MNSLKRWREPAAWVLFGALAYNLVIAVIGLVVSTGSAAVFAYRLANPVVITVLAGLVTTCVVVDRTRHARALTAASAILVGVVVGSALVGAMAGLAFGGPVTALDLLTLLANLVIPALGMVLLIKLWQLQSAESFTAGNTSAPPVISAGPPPAPPVPDPQRQPTWQPDAAAGAVWRTAGDAASGAPASGWGAPGSEVGWNPIPGDDSEAGRTDPNIR